MSRVRLMVDVDLDVEQRITSIARSESKSISEWIEEAVRNELGDRATETCQKRDRTYLAPGVSMPPPGTKPKGIPDPPKLRGTGGTVADAVIEDRR